MDDALLEEIPLDLLLDRINAQTSRDSSKVAMTFLGSGPGGGKVEKSFTYQQLSEEVDKVARQILDIGLQKGDRAVLVYPPSLNFVVAFLACLKTGVVAVPVFPPNPGRRDTLQMFSRIVSSCDASYALTSGTYKHMKKLGDIKEKLKRPAANAPAWPEQLQWVVTDGDAGKKKNIEIPPYEPSTSDIAFLQYTSGSTSEPKGVMITHGNLAHNLTIITNELKAVEDTIVVSWLPQYHDMGLIGSYLGVLYCGGSGYYISPLTFLQRPMMWIEAVSKYRGTHLQAPNFAFKLTARKFDKASYSGDKALDLGSVRHIINAAEPVTVDSINSFADAFCPFGLNKEVIYPTYGLAEHTVFVCSGGKQQLTLSKRDLEVNGVVKEVDANDESAEGEGTTVLMGCGYPSNQNVDVRIVDPEKKVEKESDVVGEIWVRSSSKAAGYYNKPDETKEDFHARISDSDGFTNEEEDGADDANDDAGDDDNTALDYLRTGDMGFLHKGELFICGRIKDLIIVGGRNYYPQDIEETAHEAVEELRPGRSAAFTVDTNHAKGEEVAFIAELRDIPKGKDVEFTCQTLADQIRSAINTEHSLGLSYIVLLKPRTIPITTSGKIARAWCRKDFVNNSLQSVYSKDYNSDSKKTEIKPMEIEDNSTPVQNSEPISKKALSKKSRKQIMEMLINDVCSIGNISRESVDKDAPLVSVLDSLSIAEFKGKLEHAYGVQKMSDEYLFRESTTLVKLVEVVKQGHAPDDTDGEGGSSTHQHPTSGGGGCAQKLGCPPGVYCVIS